MPKNAVLYGTAHCHLCDQATALVAPITQQYDVELATIDIAGDASLEARYELLIPVLVVGDAALNWPFDAIQVAEFLRKC